MTEELDKKIREIANYYVSECWGTYLDLSDVDLVQAGIGVALAVTKELQEENKDIQQSCENYYNEMRSYKNKVEDLEKQIEKMKCCNNCKYRCYMDWKSKCCFDMTEIRDIENPITCKCNKWEIEG